MARVGRTTPRLRGAQTVASRTMSAATYALVSLLTAGAAAPSDLPLPTALPGRTTAGEEGPGAPLPWWAWTAAGVAVVGAVVAVVVLATSSNQGGPNFDAETGTVEGSY